VTKALSSFSGIHTVLRAPKGDGYGAIMSPCSTPGRRAADDVSAMSQETLAGAAADIGRAIVDVDRA